MAFKTHRHTAIGKLCVTIFILVFANLFPRIIFSQKSNFVYSQFTISEGLPSNQCYDLHQDSKGLIWIATDNGVVRFDGYTFVQFGKKKGLSDNVIFTIQEDEKGDIWFGGLDNKLFIYSSEKDTIKEYAHNNIISDNSLRSSQSQEFFHVQNDTVCTSMVDHGLLIIHPSGRDSLIPIVGGVHDNLISYGNKNWLIRSYGDKKEFFKENDVTKLIQLSTKNYGYSVHDIPYFDIVKNMETYTTTFGDVTYLSLGGNLFTFDNEELEFLTATKKITGIKEITDSLTSITYDRGGGCRIYSDIKNGTYEQLLDGVSATDFLIDDKGGYWISTLEKGVFYFKPLRIKYIDEKHKGKNFRFLCKGMNNELFTGTFYGEINKYSALNSQSVELIPSSHELFLMEYDSIRNELWYSNPYSLEYFPRNDSESLLVEFNGIYRKVTSNSIYFTHETLFISLYNKYGTIDINKKRFIHYPFPSIFSRSDERIYAIYKSYNSVLVGTTNGISIIDKTNLLSPFDKELNELEIRVNKILYSNKIGYVFGTKGDGIIIYKSNDNFFILNTKNGLSSDFIESIYIDNNENLWISTLKGLDKIVLDNNNNSLINITHFNMGHGMPVNDAYDVEILNDMVYVATSKGVISFVANHENTTPPTPQMISIIVNGKLNNQFDNIILKPTENNVEFRYRTINFQMDGNINYRYRSNKGNWVQTKQTSFSLLNLESGDHVIEIQSQDENKFWSESLIKEFRILLPWWKNPYIFSIIILLSGGIGFLLIRRYHSNRNKYNKVISELRTLEKSALKAQMNPHFIFNSLNSIQYYIISNAKEEAMEFLSKFAKLIRMILQASTEEFHSLNNEIEIIKEYLIIEKMRFENSFEFKLRIQDGLKTSDILIPSMLIQPIVENAVIHGMKGKKSGGQILVSFTKINDELEVVILDNGDYPLSNTSKKAHKSLGQEITKKRLKLYSNSEAVTKLSIARDENGWTKAMILIPIKNL